jgi:hypothetical protein
VDSARISLYSARDCSYSGRDVSHRYARSYSSANDPFVTAAILSETYEEIAGRRPISNLYLASLATKPQAVGFGLFYLRELEGTASSIIFPFFGEYSKETSKGVGRTWVYPIIL